VPFIGRRDGLRVLAGRGLTGILGGSCASEQRRGKEEDGTGKRALAVRGGKERRAAAGLGQATAGPEGEK
jgi:hypothetical protein